MSEIDPNMTHRPTELDRADEIVEAALHELATSTKVDPAFATLLEAKLLAAAETMAQRAQVIEQPTWRQWWFKTFAAMRPVRYGIAIAGLVLALLLFSTPAVRATLWDWLYGTGLIAEQAVTSRTVPVETPVVGEVVQQSLMAIQTQAPFAVAPPTWFPRDLVYTNGFVDATATGTQVTLAFHPPGESTASPTALMDQPLLFMLVSDGSVEDRPLLAEEHVIPVRLHQKNGGSALAMYAHGGWRSTQPMTPEANTVDDLYWEPTADEAWLSWQMDGLNYLLYAQGLGVTREEIVRIAESIGVEEGMKR